MHCPMKLRSLWCPPAGLGANKRCQIICDPSTLARLASAAVEPRKHSSLAQSYERRGSGPNFAAALRASNHVNVRKTNAPQSRRAATATDVADYRLPRSRSYHSSTSRSAQYWPIGGLYANQHWQRSIFFFFWAASCAWLSRSRRIALRLRISNTKEGRSGSGVRWSSRWLRRQAHIKKH